VRTGGKDLGVTWSRARAAVRGDTRSGAVLTAPTRLMRRHSDMLTRRRRTHTGGGRTAGSWRTASRQRSLATAGVRRGGRGRAAGRTRPASSSCYTISASPAY
jgi:hypothetical protein